MAWIVLGVAVVGFCAFTFWVVNSEWRPLVNWWRGRKPEPEPEPEVHVDYAAVMRKLSSSSYIVPPQLSVASGVGAAMAGATGPTLAPPKLKVCVVLEKEMPKGVLCCLCGKAAKTGEVVAWSRRGSTSYPILQHRECMMKLLEDMPTQSLNVARSAADNFRKVADEMSVFLEKDHGR